MLIDIILTITGYVFKLVIFILSPFLSFVANTSGIDITSGVGYVFGNIYLLNAFLPVTELFALSYIAISVKTALFGFKVFMWLTSLMNTLRKSFISIRL